MTTPRDNRKAAEFIGWLMAGLLLLVILTGCNPYLPADPTPSATATALSEIFETDPASAAYWQLATVRPRLHIKPATDVSGRIGY